MARKKAEENVKDYPSWTSRIKPAPGELRIVHAFVNTADRQRGIDELADPRELGAWLARWRLASPGVVLTQAELEQTIELREALYTVIHSEGPRAVRAWDTVNRACARAPVVLRFGEAADTPLEPYAEGLDGALARLVVIIASAVRENRWSRMKTCCNGDCRKVFYDFAPNRVGAWCSRLCGNRIHSKTFRRRHPNYFKS